MITYILSFILCSGLLLLVYRAFLSNENLYRFNRFYLLFSLLFSLAVPLITINAPAIKLPDLSKVFSQPVALTTPVLKSEDSFAGTVVNAQTETDVTESTPIQAATTKIVEDRSTTQASILDYLPRILLGIYGLVSLFFLVRFLYNSWHINRLVTKNTVVTYDDTQLVLIDEDVTPHSFLTYVFVNKHAYENGEVEPEIICHEQTHVRQLHSLDVIFVELLRIVCWFSPFIPYYRKAIQLNHEFLADEGVIENYQNTPVYQRLLLEKASQSGSLYLTSQFNYQITKKRLIMMTKNTSAKIALYKKLAMLPLLATAIFLFSQKAVAKNENLTNDDVNTNNIRHAKTYTAKLKFLSKAYRLERKVIDTPKKVKPDQYYVKPRGMVQILINYPSTKEGVTPAQLKEYAAIESKYINATETTKFIKKTDIAPADIAKMEDLFTLMSKKQQYQQKIAFSFGLPLPKNVPTQAQLNTWANDRQYKIVIDDKLADGVQLAKHKAADFSYFYKAHIEWQVHRKYKYQHYEIALKTTPYFTAWNKKRVENSFVFNNMQPPLRVAKPVSPKNEKAVIEVKQPAVLSEMKESVVLSNVNQTVVPPLKITGEVQYPGHYTSKREMTAQEWLTMAGGITSNGSVENVKIFRAGKRVNTDVLEDALKTILLPGDSIYVARRQLK